MDGNISLNSLTTFGSTDPNFKKHTLYHTTYLYQYDKYH